MLKSLAMTIVCLAAVPAMLPSAAMAQALSSAVTRPSDVVVAQAVNYQRSPESIERQRLREKYRQRAARRRQTSWRRQYGDLAPSRQRSERKY